MKELIIHLLGLIVRVQDALVYRYYAWRAGRRQRKYVVMGNPMVGIGNRLIALANTYAWFGKENISLVWTLDPWVPTPFEELFAMTEAPGFEVRSCPRRWWMRYAQVPRFPAQDWKWWHFWAPLDEREGFANHSLRCLCDATPPELQARFRPFFAQLKPSERVRARAAECALPPDVVGVQIRNTRGMHDIALVASPETFYAKMREYGPAQKFFVSCMNADISAEVHARFGAQVLELPHKDYRSMVDAVADLWLLGQGRELILQYPSTFGEVAWWWQGGRAKTVRIDFEYRQQA